jgi:hypothetical protein
MARFSEEEFLKAVHKQQIPVLVLDQKWHHLFVGETKPPAVAALEEEINELLKRQGALNQELKDLKKAKGRLMEGIVSGMDDSDQKLHDAKMDESTRLIEEVNEKMADDEDELLDIPSLLREKSELLMMETMKYSYEKLHNNAKNISEIGNWIRQVRIDLKKNIIHKQEMEQKNQEIYAYMHDVFGADVLNLFDVRYEEKKVEEV